MYAGLYTTGLRHRVFVGALGLAACLAPQLLSAGTPGAGDQLDRDAERNGDARPSLVNLPVAFEPNLGQTDSRVNFLARGAGYALFLTPSEMVLSLARAGGSDSSVLRVKLATANRAPEIAGRNELPGKVNYFTGNDPAKWRAGIPTFARVEYKSVYPGIDLVYYGNGRAIEYDFVLSPGADPEVIKLQVEGAQHLALDPSGDLVLRLEGGELRMPAPLVYQDLGGAREPVAARYVLEGGNRLGFEVSAYDTGRTLVIDPVLVYSTFLGGSGADEALAIAIDSAGSTYVTGSTQSSNFPTASPLDSSLGGNTDAFVTKFNPNGSVAFSTFLGGGSPDKGLGIAVRAAGPGCEAGCVFVTGSTQSSNFPTTKGAYAASNKGSTDAFVTKLTAAGNAIVYSTFLGGKSADQANGIAVDASGRIHVTGLTASGASQNPFPTTSGAYDTSFNGGNDAFVSVINPAGGGTADLDYSTFVGGSGNDAGNGIAIDSSSIYVTGSTGTNAFVAKFSTAGEFQYNANLGVGVGNGIAVDGSGNAHVTGSSGSNAFVTKVNSAGTPTLLDSLAGATGKAIALDNSGNAFVTGSAAGGISPADRPFGGGATDAFVAKFSSAGTRTYFTYFGGSGNDAGNGVAAQASGDTVYVAGTTASLNFPTSANSTTDFPSHDTACGTSASPCTATLTDAFVAVLKLDTIPPTATINQAATQPDPTKISPINFTIVFSEPVTGFAAGDVTIGGTAGGTKTVVLTPAPGPTVTTYNAAVSGMTTAGTVTATIAAGALTDLAGNPNTASTSTDNTVTWANAAPAVTLTSPLAGSTTNATPTFAGGCGTVPGDSGTVTVAVYTGGSASGTPVQTLTTACVSGAFSVAGGSLPDGTHTAQARQSDVLGNIGYSSANTFTVDATAPEFGPVSNLLFQTGTEFSYATPTAIDAVSGPRPVTCSPASATTYTAGGTMFPLGETIVTCTASDVAGNTGSVEFTVMVTTDAPPTVQVTAGDVTARQGAPIPLTAFINVSLPTLTIAPDCVNTTWTIKRGDGSVVAPRVRERMYGIPNDLATLEPSAVTVVSCDIISDAAIDPVLLPPGVYSYFATYSNYVQDTDPTPPVFNVWTGSVRSTEAVLTITEPVMRVGVDIKPGNLINSWNCDSQGQGTPVAIVSGEIYDPSAPGPTHTRLFNPAVEVNAASVRFGKVGNEVGASGSPTASDVNGDGVPDLVFHFSIQGSGFSCADIPPGRQDAPVVGVVTGMTNDGAEFSGSDGIRLVTGSNQ